MRILYVPRHDAQIVSGGDIEHARLIGQHLRSLGVDMEITPVSELENQRGADAVYLTQIYQIDTAEAVAKWATRTRTPLFVSPLFEEGLRHGFRLAIGGKGNWYRLSRLAGLDLAEKAFIFRESFGRRRADLWHRQRRLLLGAHLLPNTFYELDHLRTWFQLNGVKATVVRLGIDPRRFSLDSGSLLENLPESVRSWRGAYVLQVGLISSRKNQHCLVRALHDDDLPIVFVGRPSPYELEYCKKLRRLAADRGNVEFFERVSVEALAALYGHAAAHALPSWSERPGLVSLEAAACGTRVVASTTAPIWEYLEDEVQYCEPSDERSVRRSVLAALDKPPSVASQRVGTTFTWGQTAAAFKSAIETVIGAG